MRFLGNKFFLIGSFVFILLSVPLTLYFLKQQQEVTTKAAATTFIAIDPSTKTVAVNEQFNVDIKVTPNQNEVNTVVFTINFDSSKLKLLSISPNSIDFPTTLQDPLITDTTGKIGLTTGTSIDRLVRVATKAATLTFQALTVTNEPTKITFDDKSVVILSSATADAETENVFAGSNPGSITITQAALTPSASPTITQPLTTPIANQSPVCSALNVDRETTGTSPFSITFTVNGTDADGKIQKITLDFGDGPTQDITTGGGIGTNTVSTQISHTYNNAGSYTASAVLTDDKNSVSLIGKCTQVITVNKSTSSTSGPVATPTGTVSATPIPTPIPTIAPAGDITTTLGVIGGVILLIGTGLLLFGL